MASGCWRRETHSEPTPSSFGRYILKLSALYDLGLILRIIGDLICMHLNLYGWNPMNNENLTDFLKDVKFDYVRGVHFVLTLAQG